MRKRLASQTAFSWDARAVDVEQHFNLPPVYKVQRKRGGRRQSQIHPIPHVVCDTR